MAKKLTLNTVEGSEPRIIDMLITKRADNDWIVPPYTEYANKRMAETDDSQKERAYKEYRNANIDVDAMVKSFLSRFKVFEKEGVKRLAEFGINVTLGKIEHKKFETYTRYGNVSITDESATQFVDIHDTLNNLNDQLQLRIRMRQHLMIADSRYNWECFTAGSYQHDLDFAEMIIRWTYRMSRRDDFGKWLTDRAALLKIKKEPSTL